MNSPNSGNSEMRNSLLLNSKKEKKRDREGSSSQIILRSNLKRRILQPNKNLLMNSTQPSGTLLCRINLKNNSIHMPKSAYQNGKARARTSSQSLWNSKTTRKESYDLLSQNYCLIDVMDKYAFKFKSQIL